MDLWDWGINGTWTTNQILIKLPDVCFSEILEFEKGKIFLMAISAVHYLKIPQFESEVVYEAKTDKVSKLLVDKDEYPSMTKGIVYIILDN